MNRPSLRRPPKQQVKNLDRTQIEFQRLLSGLPVPTQAWVRRQAQEIVSGGRPHQFDAELDEAIRRVSAPQNLSAEDFGHVRSVLVFLLFTQARVDLERKLDSVGDDAQLANVDLQNLLQKQQQTLQMMSNISKELNDTAMAIIRKIGG